MADAKQAVVSLENPEFDPVTMGGSIKRGIVNPDLIDERAKCDFDREEAYRVLFHADYREEFDFVARLIKKYPEVASKPNFYEMTRQEKLTEWWDRLKTIMEDPEFAPHVTSQPDTKSQNFHWWSMFAGKHPMELHQQMFTKSVKELASDEQARHWLPLINHWKIIGSYAQTELAHGSNVAGLETTCTLDLATDEFVVHTPSIRAVKFWAGSLGVQATHAVIFARCIAKEVDYGVQPFIVAVRDMQTFEPLPGVEIGDCGTKIGNNGYDHGWVKFTQLRVPRDALLSRFVSMSKEGEFSLRASPRVVYLTMVQTRTAICHAACYSFYNGVEMAVRYAACRRQFATIEGSGRER